MRIPTGPKIDWPALKREILARLDIAAEYEALGVKFTSTRANAKGWRECRAIDRADHDPSASVNVKTGVYKDFGGARKSIGFFNFAVAHGRIGDFKAVIRHYARKAGHPWGDAPNGKQDGVGHRPRMSDVEPCTSQPFVIPTSYQPADAALKPPPGYDAGDRLTVALAWLEGGYRPIPVKPASKKPIGQDWGLIVHTPESLRDVFAAHQEAGLGLLLGVDGRVIDLEVDDPGLAAPVLARLFPDGIPETLGWEANRGRHLLFAYSPRLAKYGQTIIKGERREDGEIKGNPNYLGIEIRIGTIDSKHPVQEQSVIPPTPKDDGSPRRWNGVQKILPLPDSVFWDLDKYAGPSCLDDGGDVVLTCLDDIEEKDVEWEWQGRVPKGMLTLVVGDPDVGKSFSLSDFVARVTAGRLNPGESGNPKEPGSVILLCAEDSAAHTIKPRLRAAGADSNRIHLLEWVKRPDGTLAPFNLRTELPKLELALQRVPDARVVVIDPITSYYGGASSDRDTDIRNIAGPLKDLAERRGVAIVIVSHLNKGMGVKALYRVLGSIALVALVRAAFLVVKSKDDPERRLFLCVKMNVAPRPPGLAFSLDFEKSAVVWEPKPVDMTADEVLAEEAAAAARTNRPEFEGRAAVWLKEFLADGPQRSEECVRQGNEALGLNKTMPWWRDKILKKALRGRPEKHGFSGHWEWVLSAGDEESEDTEEFEGSAPCP